ncbi:Fc.00g059350.m01.CDS01 [Cosmosporella sp. VM-42]
MPFSRAVLMQRHYVSQQHGGQYSYAQPPQPPPSPPMEDTKCSLPSISNLLGLADAGSPISDSSSSSRQQSPQTEAHAAHYHQSRPETTPTIKAESRPGSSYGKSSHRGLPPTPPMSTDASFDRYTSPSNRTIGQVSNVSHPNGYYYETTPPLEADMQRHQPPVAVARTPQGPVQEPYGQQAYPTSYINQQPMGAYYPPMQPTPSPQPQVTSLYYQRNLPQSFPPPMSMPVPASGANPWQHHHYLNPSGPNFPQSQDRYICQTCSKAFSRPSSLRIHSHSHTGEKPFKCPHAGCGKAFSVRSNMKRHERGCHSFEVNTGGPAFS